MDAWRTEYAIETSATPETIWSIFCDVPGWKNWNAGIEQIDIDGPFAAGTWFTMKPPGEEALRSQLIDVRENVHFVDETRVGDLVIKVAHRIEPLGSARTRIIYAVDAQGPEASDIGPAVSADFPEVLASLAKLAEQK
ncbi:MULTISPECIES: SRPBCC family protein [unclassified Bradyrhizobium]|uniref:SRPBCC family protein n=1 Tax=unclassified Bradyrhizobium TaxID=2631580 RepID=UPI0020B2FBA9|nr:MULTISPECIES: SRPBCC family protein [unclassified Bradyrhizobium]MCP3378901.1 SRPBCC family protein [Bradyrhizobium sp. CCGUVB4N]MCP3439613.1 SRPBCC family protein [Bradyrhizobium sp. CCGUVB14]